MSIKQRIVTLTGVSMLGFFVVFSPVLAQSVTPGKRMNQQERITNLENRADNAIEQRITSLNKAITNVQSASRLSDSQKSTLVATYQTIINNLNTLKTKIDADTDLTILRSDAKSIVVNYRVYILVLPQERITWAADRILDVAVNLNALAGKLQTRITQAQTNGKNVSVLQATLMDLQGKINDAQVQAQNAANGVAGLTPDGGDKSKLTSNNQAIQTARTAIKTAVQDLKAAWSDAKSIVAGLKAL